MVWQKKRNNNFKPENQTQSCSPVGMCSLTIKPSQKLMSSNKIQHLEKVPDLKI